MRRPDPLRRSLRTLRLSLGGLSLGAVLIALTSLVGCTTAEAERCLVSGAGSAAESDALRESCERVVPVVEALWPGWSGQVPIVRAASKLPPGVAAQVESGAVPGESAPADRLLIGPDVASELSPEGLDVVMRHELSHLAMRSTGTAALPRWASEGLAEYAGYEGVNDARRERRDDLLSLRAAVDEGMWTGTLPDTADLQGSDQRPDAYTAAWLGVTVLIEALGRETVTEAMRPVDGEPHALDEAERTRRFLQRVGVQREWLEDLWRSELERRTR